MHPTLPLAPSGYTLHVITTDQHSRHRSTHLAQMKTPDGRVAGEWTTTCFSWGLQRSIAALRESIEESLGDKATLPVYYATRIVSTREAAGLRTSIGAPTR